MSASSAASPTTPGERNASWVLPLCWSSVALEGADLVVLGVVMPSLLRSDWGLNPTTGGVIATVGLLGVMAGALTIGPLTDAIGRRRGMLITVTAFSVLTVLCAAAPDPWTFGVLRFLAGIPLGGVLPVALALVNEYAKGGRVGSSTTTLMTGYHVGAVLVSLLGIAVIPSLGWRPMFVVLAIPALVLVPLILRRLPESTWYLSARDGASDGGSGSAARSSIGTLFQRGYLGATLAFWVTSFMGLLLVYGLNTWLPEIMRSAGYELRAGLALLLVLNVGAVLGMLLAGRVSDRIGLRPATIWWFVAAMVFLALLTIRMPGVGVYVSVLLAGLFVFSAQVLVYAYIGRRYPTWARGTALGSASGVGRLGAISGPLLGGAMLSAGIAYPWGFFMFAAAAAVGAVATFLVPGAATDGIDTTRPTTSATEEG
ncbi:MFS transporter [Pseudonocardia acaciae]|uniref:MFS transporter n=1 Tax=Pseudonocardia acaciae TaxID=551276 RepID=UPI000561C610|nr:aromatic acid/H+ symport family MFS transporter [Pseudonocardia acaciae]